ncbi:MAG: ATP-binding protein [Candidatus Odinarchaeota archaeon]
MSNGFMVNEELRDSEKKYKMILDNANDLITILNDKLEHEYINENAFFDSLGYLREELIGKNPLLNIHPDDLKIATKTIRNIFRYGESRSEMRLMHKDGHYIWFEHKGKQFIDTGGITKAVIISRDISERKKAESIHLEEYKKLEELSQIKSELIMKASHELKTPLNSVYAASQFLLRNFKEQFRENELNYLEIIYRGSRKLSLLIDNLLDISKLESDELQLDLKDEDLVELIQDCVNDLTLRAHKRKINIKIDISQKCILSIDRIRLEQVIINLISNAIKFTPSNGDIFINLDDKKESIEISVKDTGIGITKKEKGQLFKKFSKIDRDDDNSEIITEGAGLGLYISKEIVELHKGKITVQSQGRNKGTTFIISLPK